MTLRKIMTIDPALYVFLVAAIILLSVVLVSLVISYLASIKRLTVFETERDQLYKETKAAQHEALLAAQDKAKEIISEATKLSDDVQNQLNEAVSNLTKDFIAAYKTQAEEVNKDTINSYRNISKDIEQYMNSHLDELKKSLIEQTIESQKMLESKFKEEQIKLDAELAKYKKEQLDNIDHNIYKILLNISRIAFGRGLSLEKHEDLIADALQETKKDIYL